VAEVPQRRPGLKAVYDGREQRQRGRFSRMTPRVVLFGISSFFTILLVYGFFAKRSLDKAKIELLAKQRAVESTLGPEWFPLRDKLEKLTIDTAKDWPGDWVDTGAGKALDFRASPGIYLRLRVSEAKDVETLRAAARMSVKDSFSGCLMRGQAVPIGDGGLGNEQPWNLRQAYASTRVLTDAWVSEVKASGDDLRLRVFEQQFQKATRDEIPLAVEIVKRAQFYLLVLDEDAPEAATVTDAGTITMEALQLVAHDSRVRIWNLKTGNEIARIRRRGEGSFRFVGEQGVKDPEALEAMQRQVNNCALANRVKEALSLK
jgi:hypothetical protein